VPIVHRLIALSLFFSFLFPSNEIIIKRIPLAGAVVSFLFFHLFAGRIHHPEKWKFRENFK